MNQAAWKTLERYWAKAEGGVRLWRQDFSESIPDGENDWATWDTKCWQHHSLPGWNLYWKCRDKYKGYTGDRHFKLVLRPPASRRGALVVMHEDEYNELTLCRLQLKEVQSELLATGLRDLWESSGGEDDVRGSDHQQTEGARC